MAVVGLALWAGGWVAGLAQPYGLSNRVANTTLRLPPNPPMPPSYSYATTNAFGALSFTDPVVITSPPGESNRVFVVEQAGRIIVITNLAAPTRTVFLDIDPRVEGGVPFDERGLLGMAFHPGYATNRFFFLYYSTTANTGTGAALHQRLGRFETSAIDPNQGLAGSEVPLLTMYDDAGNHNGGALLFGLDGYLYVSTGDEGGGNDTYNNSQIIDKDFWAGILRLDVDNRPGNLVPNPHAAIAPGSYRVPSDNPFVGVTSWHGSNLVATAVRTEFYAVGLRNPWRMSLDPDTGRIYCADVGQSAREEVNIIVQGGNYGWAFREGTIAGPKPTPPGAVHVPPILDYGRGTGTNQGSSVTGGVVYRGGRYPQLFGRYVFADYVSGNVWSVFHDGVTTTPLQRLTGDNAIAGFGIDPSNGDVLLADQDNDTVKRLIVTGSQGGDFPATLQDTGAFADLEALTPHAGIVAYDVNVPYWTDNALKRRWFSVPDPNQRITFRFSSTSYNWTFPSGTVWIQHFDLDLTNGVPESRRRLETRFLVRDNTPAGIYGVTYRWDDAQTNAVLVAESGELSTFVIHDGGIVRTQVWQYPSRSECLACHRLAPGLALGFNTPQLNRDFDYGEIVDNQIRSLEHAGYFQPFSPVTNLHLLPALAHPTNSAVSVEYRVRSYLMANCAYCHMPGGASRGLFDARIYRSLPETRLVNGDLVDNGGDPANKVIVPGVPEHSVLLKRLSSSGPDRMPPLDVSLLDAQAIHQLTDWITHGLASYQTFPEWQLANFGSTNAPGARAEDDFDLDGDLNNLEYLIGSDPTSPADQWAGVGIERQNDTVELTYQRVPNRGFEVQLTTNPAAPTVWQRLNIPENAPVFSAQPQSVRVPDTITNAPAKFYRIRVFQP